MKTLQKMIGKSPVQNQKDLFQPMLTELIDMSHELVLLANKIDWKHFENRFQSIIPILASLQCPFVLWLVA